MTARLTPLDYIATSLHRRPDARIKAIDVVRRFRRQLPNDRARTLWPRWRILEEVRKEFIVGTDGDRTTVICGLSFRPPKEWRADETGRLVLVQA